MEEKHLYNEREKISLLVGTTMFRISKGYFLQRCEGAGVDILGHSVISEPGGVIVSGIVTAMIIYSLHGSEALFYFLIVGIGFISLQVKMHESYT